MKLIENLEIENSLINILLNGGKLGEGIYLISLKDFKENIKKLYDGNELIINSLENLKESLLGVNLLVDSNLKIKDTLEKVVNGGEIEGNRVPGLNNLSNLLSTSLSKLKEGLSMIINKINQSFKELTNSLDILIRGGKVKDIYFYGFEDSLKGVKKLKDGLDSANKEIEKQKDALNKKVELTKKFDSFIGKPNSSESRVQFIVKISP